jgi:hypothetical protein
VGKKGSLRRVSRRCEGGGGGERECRLIKHDVARDEDTARREVQTTIPLMLRGVAKEDTESGTGGQLMRSGGCVGVTSAPKHTKVIVAGRGTEKSVVWCGAGEAMEGKRLRR